MKQIIFKGTDGSVAIMTLAVGADKKETIQKFRDSHPSGKYPEYYENDTKLPDSREFRDAWTLKDGKVIVDDNKSKMIHIDRIRHARNMELKRLDQEQLQHLYDEAKSLEIKNKKQELRDLPSWWKSLEWPNDLLGERK